MPTLFGQRQIQIQASREGWQSRPRQGQGGGKEYAFSSLPTGVQAALALRWWATETEDGPIQKAKDGDPLSDLRWDAFLRLPKSQQAVGHKHMAALMALQTLQANGQTLKQAIAALRAQGAVPNRSTVFRWLKCVKGHPKIHWAQPYHDPAKAKAVAGNITFPPFMGPRGLVPWRGVGSAPRALGENKRRGVGQRSARAQGRGMRRAHI